MNKYMRQIMRLTLAGFCLVMCYACATVVHVIPLWYDTTTKNWEILLGRNTGTAIWTDFDHGGTEDPITLARSTIKNFTHNRYNEKNAPLESGIDIINSNQHFFFIPVTEKLDNLAMRRARNNTKSEFTWVSASVLAGYGQVLDPRKRKSGRITVEPNFRATFGLLWPEVTKKLSESIAPKVLSKS